MNTSKYDKETGRKLSMGERYADAISEPVTGFALYKGHAIDVERVGEAQNIYVHGKPVGHTYSHAAIAIGRAVIDQREQLNP